MDIKFNRLEVSEKAKSEIEKIRAICIPYWARLPEHPFVKSLREGTLSLEGFSRYYTQWGKVIGELILTLYSNTLSRFNSILLKYPDIQNLVISHMVEELSHQGEDGVYMKTARALGIERNEIIEARLIPELQAYLNWVVKLSYQGTFAEIRASSFANEGCLSSVSSAIAVSLVEKYGLKKEEAAYYVEHGPADKEHVEINGYVLSRLIDLGYAEERPGYGLAYCAENICKTNLLMLDGAYREFKEQESSRINTRPGF